MALQAVTGYNMAGMMVVYAGKHVYGTQVMVTDRPYHGALASLESVKLCLNVTNKCVILELFLEVAILC